MTNPNQPPYQSQPQQQPYPPQGYPQGQYPPPGYPQPQPPKAKPMYRRAWFWIVVVIIAIIIGVGSNKGKKDDTASNSNPTGNATTHSATEPGVSQGLGANKATGDVVLGRPKYDPDTQMATARVTITNHSSKRSDYFIDVTLETADGKRQLDDGSAIVSDLESGQSSVQKVVFFGLDSAPPAGWKMVLKSVQRTSSI